MPHTLHIRKDGKFVKLKEPYSTYREAVLDGQKLGGYGAFYVESPTSPPPTNNSCAKD